MPGYHFFATLMKTLFSILLFLITSIYVLPVKETFTDCNNICLTDVEDEKEKTKKKEKELFSFSNSYSKIIDSYSSTHSLVSYNIFILLKTVETPPPDLA